jgi:hypothetical protein
LWTTTHAKPNDCKKSDRYSSTFFNGSERERERHEYRYHTKCEAMSLTLPQRTFVSTLARDPNSQEDSRSEYNPTTMKTTLFLITSSLLAHTASAFQVAPVLQVRSPLTTLWSFPEKFARAVQCSETFGLCDATELLELADELESYHGSFFEDERRDKEIKDRNDMAKVLRLEAELALKQDELQRANLFKADVEEAVEQKTSENFVEMVETYIHIDLATYD